MECLNAGKAFPNKAFQLTSVEAEKSIQEIIKYFKNIKLFKNFLNYEK